MRTTTRRTALAFVAGSVALLATAPGEVPAMLTTTRPTLRAEARPEPDVRPAAVPEIPELVGSAPGPGGRLFPLDGRGVRLTVNPGGVPIDMPAGAGQLLAALEGALLRCRAASAHWPENLYRLRRGIPTHNPEASAHVRETACLALDFVVMLWAERTGETWFMPAYWAVADAAGDGGPAVAAPA